MGNVEEPGSGAGMRSHHTAMAHWSITLPNLQRISNFQRSNRISTIGQSYAGATVGYSCPISLVGALSDVRKIRHVARVIQLDMTWDVCQPNRYRCGFLYRLGASHG